MGDPLRQARGWCRLVMCSVEEIGQTSVHVSSLHSKALGSRHDPQARSLYRPEAPDRVPTPVVHGSQGGDSENGDSENQAF
eukprot:1192839-Prorocentrum_minimum.AAC.3